MAKLTGKLASFNQVKALQGAGAVVGQIVDVDEQGRPWVVVPGKLDEAVMARSVILASDAVKLINATVVLLFEDNNIYKPIILGVISENLEGPRTLGQAVLDMDEKKDVILDRKTRVVLEADKELVLKCGKSSITMRKDGKIIVKGVNLVNRASQHNKIKGANVNIN